MTRAALLSVILALASAACTRLEDVAPGTVVTCSATADCPGGRICNRNRCVLPSELGIPPDLVLVDGKLAVAPAAGRAGTTFTVVVEATKELEAPPRVILSLDSLVELPCSATAARTYSCAYTADGSERGGLGGHVTIDVRLTDLVGQEVVKNGVGGFDLDFAPPVLAARSVAPASAPLGGVVQVFFTTDEDLGPNPVLVASRALDEPGGDGRRFPLTRQPGTRNYLFTHLVTTGDASGPVDFTVELTDAVGNAAFTVPVGSVVLDPVPPAISALAVSPARLAAAGTLSVTFDATEVGSVVATVGGRAMACGGRSETSPNHTCTRAMVGNEIAAGTEAPQAVAVTLTDLAGNRTAAGGTIVFDFRPPGVAAATVAYTPPDGSVLPMVARATTGARVTATILADEALDPAVVPSLVAGTIPFTYLAASSTATSAVFQAEVPPGTPDGDCVATVTWADVAGNRTATSTGVPRVRIKTSAPTLVVDQAALTFVRSPQGNAAPEALGAYVIPAGPYFAVEPSDALTTATTLPASSLRLADGGTLARVIVQSPSATPVTLGVLVPDGAGRVPRQALLSPDVTAAQLVGVDDAGNRSAAVRLQSAEWVASSNRPVGVSAHHVYPIPIAIAAREPPADVTPASGTEDRGADGSSAVVSGAVQWALRDPRRNESPPGRADMGMTHDAVRGRIVMFGGYAFGQDSNLGDTWEWDGSAWHDLTPPAGLGPSARQAPMMAYDSARRVTVLFGGSGNVGPLQDTWEWDGETWRDVTPAGLLPAARSGARMVFDAARGRTVLFGGSGFQDTWVWDGSTWRDVTPASVPPERYGFGAAYDAARAVAVIFGGWGAGRLDDTWEWDGTTWTRRYPARIPAARERHAMAYDGARARVMMLGGDVGTPAPHDVWQWDGTNWTSVTPPGSASVFGPGPGMAYDAVNRVVFLFGGRRSSSSDFEQEQVWDGTSWTSLGTETTGPTWRHEFAMAFDANRGHTVMFGGKYFPPGGISDLRKGDTWEWDGSAWRDVSPPAGESPASRWGHSMVYDAYRLRTLLFGGTASTGATQDTWEWDGTSWTSLTPARRPDRRRYAAMAYDAGRRRTVLFGGNDAAAALLQDTWEWDGSNWTSLTPATRPSARRFHAMAHDASRGVVVLFGGNDGAADLGDTWVWNGTTWTRVYPVGALPPARSKHALAWDPGRNRILLTGGTAATGTFVDAWELAWNGSAWAWAEITPAGPGPSARSGPALAFDRRRGRAVLFGGSGTEDVAVWELDTRTTRIPAVQLEASFGAAGFGAADVRGMRVRAWAGGVSGAGTPGAVLHGWASLGTGAGMPGWASLAANSAGLASAPPANAMSWSAASAADARRFLTERDGTIAFQVRPSGEASTSAAGATVGLDYLELRVRYAVP